MAYREVGTMDMEQVIRRWLAGEKIRGIARLTGLDRNMIRRIVRSTEKVGVRREAPWPDAGKLQAIRQGIGRPGATVATSEAEQRLKPRTDQIRTWLEKEHLLLTKVHELLDREGLLTYWKENRVRWRDQHLWNSGENAGAGRRVSIACGRACASGAGNRRALAR